MKRMKSQLKKKCCVRVPPRLILVSILHCYVASVKNNYYNEKTSSCPSHYLENCSFEQMTRREEEEEEYEDESIGFDQLLVLEKIASE